MLQACAQASDTDGTSYTGRVMRPLAPGVLCGGHTVTQRTVLVDWWAGELCDSAGLDTFVREVVLAQLDPTRSRLHICERNPPGSCSCS
jgi:hypothetical protein